MISVMITMGFLIVTGKTVHIMSSMIPIFIMPIAVLDSIHILSEFFDRYQETKDRRKTILHVMDTFVTSTLLILAQPLLGKEGSTQFSPLVQGALRGGRMSQPPPTPPWKGGEQFGSPP